MGNAELPLAGSLRNPAAKVARLWADDRISVSAQA
jgi:hypothetical protein